MEDNIPKFKLKKLGSDQEETKPAKPTTAEFETNQQDNHDAPDSRLGIAVDGYTMPP